MLSAVLDQWQCSVVSVVARNNSLCGCSQIVICYNIKLWKISLSSSHQPKLKPSRNISARIFTSCPAWGIFARLLKRRRMERRRLTWLTIFSQFMKLTPKKESYHRAKEKCQGSWQGKCLARNRWRPRRRGYCLAFVQGTGSSYWNNQANCFSWDHQRCHNQCN